LRSVASRATRSAALENAELTEAADTNTARPKRKRRWFQFSLRTLMIAVTMFCIVVGGYVGQQVKIVQERKAMAQWIKAQGGFELPSDDGAERPSFLRCWLGDHTVEEVFWPNRIDGDEAAQNPRDISRGSFTMLFWGTV
jgi:hypothetical protein